MSKKIWTNPELLNLGVEKTYDDSDLYKPEDNLHYCHDINDFHTNKDCPKGHRPNNGCNDPDKHPHNNGHQSKCCCKPIVIDPSHS